MRMTARDSHFEKSCAATRLCALKLIEKASSCDVDRVHDLVIATDMLPADDAATLGALVGALCAGVFGAPVPEEVVFAVAGWRARTGALTPGVAYVVLVATVALLDLGVFEVGRRLGPSLRRSRLGRRLPRRRWAYLRAFIARRGALAVGLARLAMGARVPTFLLAGAGGMSRGRFVAVAWPFTLISSAWPFALGASLPDGPAALDVVWDHARWVGPLLLVSALVVVAWVRRRPRRQRA